MRCVGAACAATPSEQALPGCGTAFLSISPHHLSCFSMMTSSRRSDSGTPSLFRAQTGGAGGGDKHFGNSCSAVRNAKVCCRDPSMLRRSHVPSSRCYISWYNRLISTEVPPFPKTDNIRHRLKRHRRDVEETESAGGKERVGSREDGMVLRF